MEMENKEFVSKLGKMTDSALAQEYGYSMNYVFSQRRERNIKSYRTAYGRKVPADYKLIQKEYEELGSMQAVADKYGCTRQYISKILKEKK